MTSGHCKHDTDGHSRAPVQRSGQGPATRTGCGTLGRPHGAETGRGAPMASAPPDPAVAAGDVPRQVAGGWSVLPTRRREGGAAHPASLTNAGHSREAHKHLRFDACPSPGCDRWPNMVPTAAEFGHSGRHRPGRPHRPDPDSAPSSQAALSIDALARGDRSLLERYLAWLSTEPSARRQGGRRHRAGHVLPGDPPARLRQHPAQHRGVLSGDIPRCPPRLSRHLAEHVMTQVEAPANLDRWQHPQGTPTTLILITCGLRASDGCSPAFACLVHDGHGAPYLHYLNHKMRREAAVPSTRSWKPRSAAGRLCRRPLARRPSAPVPALTGNANGQRALTYQSYPTGAQRLPRPPAELTRTSGGTPSPAG
jgi:hypothetical protein